MEFLEYIKKRNRMMDSIGRKSGRCIGVSCGNCCDLTKVESCFEDVENFDPERAESIVQKWADEHPVMTNAQKFEEVFGAEPASGNSSGLFCPPLSVRKYECSSIECAECVKWWLEEYKEQKNGK